MRVMNYNKSRLLLSFSFVLVLFLLSLVLVLPTFVAALDLVSGIAISITPSEQTVSGTDPVRFTVAISNEGTESETITPRLASSLDWDARFNPDNVTLVSGARAVLSVTISPRASARKGSHDLTLQFLRGSELIERTVTVNIPETTVATLVQLSPESQIPREIDPNYPIQATLVVINQESTARDLTARLRSGTFLESSVAFSLGPYARKEVPLTITIPAGTPPQDADLNIIFSENNRVLAEFTRPITIIPTNFPLQETLIEEKGFLKRQLVYRVHNPSNVAQQSSFAAPVSFFGRIFSSTVPEARYDDARRSYVWDLALAGDAVQEVRVVYNYRSLFYLLIVFFLLVVGFHFFKPDIFISKKVSQIHYHDDGTFAAAKIVLHLKNKTRETMSNVKVIETLPEITHYQHKKIPGSLEPSSIKQLDHLVKICWDIDELSPSEERIIVYYVQSRLGVVGNLTLPAAKIMFARSGKNTMIYSNTLQLPTLRERRSERSEAVRSTSANERANDGIQRARR